MFNHLNVVDIMFLLRGKDVSCAGYKGPRFGPLLYYNSSLGISSFDITTLWLQNKVLRAFKCSNFSLFLLLLFFWMSTVIATYNKTRERGKWYIEPVLQTGKPLTSRLT